jgi:hypothetical protein
MEMTPLSLPASLVFITFSVIWLVLCWYHGRKAWGMASPKYIEYLQSERPKNWFRSPVFGFLWRLTDATSRLTLWQARVICILGAILGLMMLYIGAINVVRIVLK